MQCIPACFRVVSGCSIISEGHENVKFIYYCRHRDPAGFFAALVFSVDYREEDSEESMENAESPDDEEDAIGFYLVGARKKQKKEES